MHTARLALTYSSMSARRGGGPSLVASSESGANDASEASQILAALSTS